MPDYKEMYLTMVRYSERAQRLSAEAAEPVFAMLLWRGDIVREHFREKYRLLGLKIAYYRRKRGYTQEQLAELIDKNVFTKRCT